jgi:hypothetical protein
MWTEGVVKRRRCIGSVIVVVGRWGWLCLRVGCGIICSLRLEQEATEWK